MQLWQRPGEEPPLRVTLYLQCTARAGGSAKEGGGRRLARWSLPGEPQQRSQQQQRGREAGPARRRRGQGVRVGRDAAGVAAGSQPSHRAVVLQGAEAVERAAAAPDLLHLARQRHAVGPVVPANRERRLGLSRDRGSECASA